MHYFYRRRVDKSYVRKKIRRAYRFAQMWGEQFHGEDFDMASYWNETSSVDINKQQFSVGEEVVEVQFGATFDEVDESPQN